MMSKKKGKKKGFVGRGGESLAEAGEAGSCERERVDDVSAKSSNNDIAEGCSCEREHVDDVSSAKSSNHDKDEGSEGSDPEWHDNEDNVESNADDDDDAAVNLKDKKDCNDDDTKRVPNLDWTIEGLDGLDEKHIRHSNAFYSLLKKWYAGKEYTSVLMTKASYDKIVRFLIYMRDGGDCRESYLAGNLNAYTWYRKYHVFTVGGDDNAVLVIRPTKLGAVDVTALALSYLQQPSYAERLYADLWRIHKEDHCKGITFFYRVRDKIGNVTREVCKMFTDVCPHCVAVLSRRKPVAGIKNIVTDGMGVRGQVDLIDFQSMPDGAFKFLLNYIDHGVKKLSSVPLVSKRASSVALALFNIFTEQGPPSILQADNGGEFSNHAHDHSGKHLLLDDDYIDLIIKELKNLWPECTMVRGSPRHSESNGGVERVNQTVQKKLGAWMNSNNTKHWSIGCKLVQWRYNTQIHQTIKDSPYRLTYGMHPRVGISNLPISENILTNLVTEAEYNDVILQMEQNNTSLASVAGVGAEEPKHMSLSKKRKWSPKEATEESMAVAVVSAKPTAQIGSPVDLAKEGLDKDGSFVCTPRWVGGKSIDDDTPSYNRWLELIDEREEAVDISEISNARVNKVFPIIYCTNNKDITDDSNWAPCILRKVRKEQYEILDTNEDIKVGEDLDWNGDDGLTNDWGMYYKYPSDTFIDSFRDLVQISYENNIANDISPRRLSLRKNATANVQKKADSVTKKVIDKSPDRIFKPGDVVLVPLDDVDRTKVDGGNLCGVVVTIDKKKTTCRVAVKQGLLHRAYVYHKLKPVPEASNNREVLDLQEAFEDWRSLPKITEREAARFISSVGGQGIVHCNCRGSCVTNSCTCKKAGRLCSSRCHRNNKQCKNMHDIDDPEVSRLG